MEKNVRNSSQGRNSDLLDSFSNQLFLSFHWVENLFSTVCTPTGKHLSIIREYYSEILQCNIRFVISPSVLSLYLLYFFNLFCQCFMVFQISFLRIAAMFFMLCVIQVSVRDGRYFSFKRKNELKTSCQEFCQNYVAVSRCSMFIWLTIQFFQRGVFELEVSRKIVPNMPGRLKFIRKSKITHSSFFCRLLDNHFRDQRYLMWIFVFLLRQLKKSIQNLDFKVLRVGSFLMPDEQL